MDEEYTIGIDDPAIGEDYSVAAIFDKEAQKITKELIHKLDASPINIHPGTKLHVSEPVPEKHTIRSIVEYHELRDKLKQQLWAENINNMHPGERALADVNDDMKARLLNITEPKKEEVDKA